MGRQWSLATVAEMKYFMRAAGKTKRNRARDERIRGGDLRVDSLRDSVEKRQLRLFGNLCRMDEDRDASFLSKARRMSSSRKTLIIMMVHIARIGQKKGKSLNSMKALARDQDAWQV